MPRGEINMATWLHRVSHWAEFSEPLLEKGFLSTGWSHFAEQPGFLSKDFFMKGKKDRAAFGQYFEKQFPSLYRRTRFNLWSFIAEMEKGDWVLVPLKWGRFSVYELEDDCVLLPSELDLSGLQGDLVLKDGILHAAGRTVDLGFFRRIKSIRVDIPRGEYADSALTSLMKYQGTTLNSDSRRPNIDKAVEAHTKGKPINLYGEIIEGTWKQVLDIIRDRLNPDKFERLIKQYFEHIGATILPADSAHQRGKADADVVAAFELAKASALSEETKVCVYVQAKYHKGATDASWAREQIAAYKSAQEKDAKTNQQYQQYWVISSCDKFENEDEARKEAKENGILLINGEDFAKMLLETGLSYMHS